MGETRFTRPAEATRIVVCVASIAMATASCGSPERECNAARVTAFEAWSASESALEPHCGLFAQPFWRNNRDAAADGMARMALGRASSEQVAAIQVETAIEEYRSQLTAACRAVREAKDAANQNALVARESSSSAHDALNTVLRQHAQVLAQLRERAGDGEATTLFAAHSTALAATSLPASLAQAQSASAASWAACNEVDP